jgi:excinuclease UvrABC ATPase subunit
MSKSSSSSAAASTAPQDVIRIRGARQNNLKGIDLDLPLNQLTVITGPSGSGKSSLAFDTIYAEGQRRYVETFSPYTRQFFERMDKPQVDSIEGIPPAIAIEQVNNVRSTRSTVGTITEINDYLKMVFPRLAEARCPSCEKPVRPETPEHILQVLIQQHPEKQALLVFPVPAPVGSDAGDFASFLQAQGFLRIWLYGEVIRLDDETAMKKRKLPAMVQVVQDRVTIGAGEKARLSESIEAALRLGKGKMAAVIDGKPWPFSTGWHCASCDITLPTPTPGLFSFNNPVGACPTCRGFGKTLGLDLRKAMPDESLSIADGLVKAFTGSTYAECQTDLITAALKRGIDIEKPFDQFSEKDRKWLIEGTRDDPEQAYKAGEWYGVRGFFKWQESRAYKMHVRVFLSRYRAYTDCPDCDGGRLKKEALLFRIHGQNVADLWKLPVERLLPTVESWPLPEKDHALKLLRDEVVSRLSYLQRAGLGYLNLDRQTRTLSGGELQRVNLTTCLGASLVNTLFVLDEPSIGLHPRDIGRLIGVMEGLRDKGNTLLVVEHEESVMRAADHIVDIGPGRGEKGGQLLFSGPMEQLLTQKGSLTADYLSGRKAIELPRIRRPVDPNPLDNQPLTDDSFLKRTLHAYASICDHSNAPLRDRSEEAARAAADCAQELYQRVKSQSFGWSRRQKREGLYDGQLDCLRQAVRPFKLPAGHIGGGGEHEVYHRDRSDCVWKVTNNSQFGYVVDQASDDKRNKLHLRPALPFEYLLRLGTQNLVFGDRIIVEGVQGGAIPRIVTSQQAVDDGRPSQEEVNAFLEQSGFVKLDIDLVIAEFANKPFWYRASDSVITAGANPENFSRVGTHNIVPIDLIIHPYPRELLESTAKQNGVRIPKPAAKASTSFISIRGARHHNLKNVDVDVPLGVFCCITGVSGSGKSTLVHDVLYRNLQRVRGEVCEEEPGLVKNLAGYEKIGSVVMVDQSPLARTPRSTPAVFLGAFDGIRALFADTDDAKAEAITPGFFSFNSGAGRCERCWGNGFEKIEMQFLSDLYVTCPECEGKRYQPHALKFTLQGKNIHEVLGLTIEDAVIFFEKLAAEEDVQLASSRSATSVSAIWKDTASRSPRLSPQAKKCQQILHPLRLICEAGLGYLRLGQPLNTLSGGEAQRLKLIGHLLEPEEGNRKSLLLLDEPTTGLHFDDIALLVKLLQRLADEGHSLVVIEHNMEVIKCADWIIDLGPEGGEAGGQIVCVGPPETVAECEASYTGGFLRDLITDTLREVPAVYRTRKTEHQQTSNVISIRGAREHNLKNISVDIPRDELVVVTGLSGSGKSSLAFDLVFAEGQRRFLDSMSVYARTFVEQMEKPEVDLITGVPPTVAIEQRISRGSGKSTVATVTEVYHFLRLLFAKLGTQHCPKCSVPVKKQSTQAIVQAVADYAKEGGLHLLAPLIKARKGFHNEVAEHARKQGIETLLVDGVFQDTLNFKRLERFKEHTIDAVVSKIEKKMKADAIRADVERALKMGKGTLKVLMRDKTQHVLNSQMSCPSCGWSFEELDPRLFSFNSPHGWCKSCRGFGVTMGHAPGEQDRGGDVSQLELEMHEERRFSSEDDEEKPREICKECNGSRINEIARAVQLQGVKIQDFAGLSAESAGSLMDKLKFTGTEAIIARDIVNEIRQRLHFMKEVGLGYLQLNRSADTLSGGEAQRIRLSAQLGSNLRGVLYVLDEPTIGLHPRDNEKLLNTLVALRDKGNSLLVVEHDDETMRRANTILDLGPGAGRFGGQVIAQGTLPEILKNKASVTGQSLKEGIPHPMRGSRRKLPAAKSKDGWITLTGAKANNLKNVNVQLPLARLTIITGVSGSGKSSLMHGSLLPAVRDALQKTGKRKTESSKTYTAISGLENIEYIHEVDQSPIGKTSRSCPATYVGIWDEIRKLFAQVPLARARGYTPSRFSFNTEGGRCEVCEGNGGIKVEMNFLPTTIVPCDTCHGARFNSATLEVEYNGKTIGDVMRMSIDEAAVFFEAVSKIARPLRLMADTGLGYLQLGQPSPTLSGGEAQRIKLVTELRSGDGRTAKERLKGITKAGKRNLYLIEEPTIGLHLRDVARLIDVLHRLVDEGHTVVVIEHHPDVYLEADYLIDVGPEAGEHGGKIVAAGTPEQVAKVKESRTARFLRTP